MTNLLKNPGFEEGSLAGWSNRNFQVVFSSHSGSYAASRPPATGEVAGAGYLRQDFAPVPAEQIREASVWYVGGDPSTPMGSLILIYSDGSNDGFDLPYASSWRKMNAAVRAGKSLSGVEVDIGPAPTDFMVDDVTVDKAEAGTTPPPPSVYALEIQMPNPASGGTTDPPPGNYTYSSGSQVKIAATAFKDFKFHHWVLNGKDVGASNPLEMTMNQPHSLQAWFEYVPPPTAPGEPPPPPPPPLTPTTLIAKGEVKGKVTGFLGLPAIGAKVSALTPTGPVNEVNVNTDGSYAMMIPAGTYDGYAVRLLAMDFRTMYIKPGASTTLNFKLSPVGVTAKTLPNWHDPKAKKLYSRR